MPARGPRLARSAQRLLAAALALSTCTPGARAQATGWVEAFSTLRLRPGFEDPRATLAERMALARALGRYGPAADAVPALRDALQRDPPKALRDELLSALARRGSPAARDELIALLAQPAPPPNLALALGALDDPKTVTALVRALGREASADVAREGLLRIGAGAANGLGAALSKRRLALRAAAVLQELGPCALAARPALERALVSRDPALRAAAAGALGAVGDARSARALVPRLRDEPPVALAAMSALATVATAAEASALAERLTAVPAEQRPLALRALATADPARAAAELGRALRAGDQASRDAALDVLHGDEPDPSWTAVLGASVRGEHVAASASALARIEGGRGLDVLLALVRKDATLGPRVARALAVGLRRFSDELDGDVRDGALAVLRALPKGERRLVLRALARDGDVRDEIATALHSAEPQLRAAAATAARMLGDPALAPDVRAALLRERDQEAIRRLCEAARTLGVELPLRAFERWLSDPQTAPEAAALASVALRGDPPLALRAELRRLLDPGQDARARVGAALALGALGDETAWPALKAALDDPTARVRLAAVQALGALGGAHAREALLEHARIEHDPLVRNAALDRLEGVKPPDGDRVLEAQVLTTAGPRGERSLLDVLLDDGRWLRLRTLADGELLLEDLPPGQADVRAVQ